MAFGFLPRLGPVVVADDDSVGEVCLEEVADLGGSSERSRSTLGEDEDFADDDDDDCSEVDINGRAGVERPLLLLNNRAVTEGIDDEDDEVVGDVLDGSKMDGVEGNRVNEAGLSGVV